jgi:hypothetical protein
LEEKELEIFSENHQQDSIEVLSYLGFLFDDIGFKVETTKKRVKGIGHHVLFG